MTRLPLHATIDADPAAVLDALPSMGALMINARGGGALHERIGTVERTALAAGWLTASGAEHHSSIELDAVHAMVFDGSSIMQDKTYPRIDLLGKDEAVIASIIGFAGAEPFEAALANFTVTPCEQKEKPARPAPVEVAEDDAALSPFQSAHRNQGTIRIALERPHFNQSWTGTAPEPRVSRGFVNIMQPDFHLHLRGGEITSWRETAEDGTRFFHALDAGGTAIGLVVSGAPHVFQ